MKTILTLAFTIICLFLYSQIGVVTLQKNTDHVPMDMWYTMADKGRENQMYFTSHDEEFAKSILDKVLQELEISPEDTVGIDEEGSPYWGVDLGNGFHSWVFWSDEDPFFTVTILAEEND